MHEAVLNDYNKLIVYWTGSPDTTLVKLNREGIQLTEETSETLDFFDFIMFSFIQKIDIELSIDNEKPILKITKIGMKDIPFEEWKEKRNQIPFHELALKPVEHGLHTYYYTNFELKIITEEELKCLIGHKKN